MPTCDRCRKETRMYTTSWFNTDALCPDCDDKEQEHPDLAYAKQVESAACSRGEFNFPGVGWPGVGGRVQK